MTPGTSSFQSSSFRSISWDRTASTLVIALTPRSWPAGRASSGEDVRPPGSALPPAPTGAEDDRTPANDVFTRAASISELEIEAALGRLTVDGVLPAEVESAGFTWLPITERHARAAARLPLHHRDPFDRMLIAQARLEGHTIITRDDVFRRYDVDLIRA
jgi:PIN domain nuclease of toxin-antitoxin system